MWACMSGSTFLTALDWSRLPLLLSCLAIGFLAMKHSAKKLPTTEKDSRDLRAGSKGWENDADEIPDFGDPYPDHWMRSARGQAGD